MSLAADPRLTRRQDEVLRLLVGGLPAQEIAYRLRLRPMTVRHHLSALYRKLGCQNGTQAVVYALRHRLVELSDPEEDGGGEGDLVGEAFGGGARDPPEELPDHARSPSGRRLASKHKSKAKALRNAGKDDGGMTIHERQAEFTEEALGDPVTSEIALSPEVRVAGFGHAVLLDIDDQVYALGDITRGQSLGPRRPPEVGLRGIWLHQFDLLPNPTVEAITTAWTGPVYVKALDGVDWMARFDTSPLAVQSMQGAPPYWSWKERGWVPWTVPRGGDPVREGQLTGQLAEAAGNVILDLEPYKGFWEGTEWGAEHFVDAYFAETQVLPQICLDHRRLRDGFPYDTFLERVAGLLPQVYWTDFQRPWLEVLEEAAAVLAPLQRPIEYVLPGNARAADLQAARAWCTARGAPASLWVWQTILPENWP
jgi:DNA-binding CsgD family transcriptional regulator